MENYEPPELIEETLEIPVREECDVLVVGGGAAGVMAALAAAQNGARTILVEQNTYLGGDMLSGAAGWMGFYNIYKPEKKEAVRLVRGITDDLVKRLEDEEGTIGFYEEDYNPEKESMHIQAEREVFPNVFLEMLKDYGVKIYLRCMVVDTIVETGGVKGIIMESKSGREAIFARVTVDCSGNADVAFHAGVKTNEIRDRQSTGMAFGMAGVELEKTYAYLKERALLAVMGRKQRKDGFDSIAMLGFHLAKIAEFTPYLEQYHLHGEPCIISNRPGYADMINGVTMRVDTSSPRALSEAAITLNDCCLQMGKLFQKYLPGFENAYVDWISAKPGIRFTRQVECIYDISRKDLDELVIPKDCVGVFGVQDGCYKGYTIKGGGWYGIPYRALIPKDMENLLVAGRMISSDWVVFMSTRLIGCCMVQGEAAGTAAALAALQKCSVSDLDITVLQNALRKDGVFLG